MLFDAKNSAKLASLERIYEPLRFARIAELPLEKAETCHHFRAPPIKELEWTATTAGDRWGDNRSSAWFRGQFTVPAEAASQPLFLRIETGAPEALLFVDGNAAGSFDLQHPVRLAVARGEANRRYQVYVEAYAGYAHPGTQPHPGIGLQNDAPVSVSAQCRLVGQAELLVERTDVSQFIFDLRTLNQLASELDENDLRRARIQKALQRVLQLVFAKPDEVSEHRWRPGLADARQVMAPLLAEPAAASTPLMGIVGHSHLDTAWLWPIRETWRKCARTFSSVLSLMEQYPEFRFSQTPACHADAVRRLYPVLFEKIQQRVREGRWEINGATWIEPDCNLPGGEALVRQFLFGQRATREMFGVTSDTFWQPDVFGYSAALPQILRGSGVRFFCTTKLAWNDTNRFPYDTFHWQGLDGSAVLTHFNIIHCSPDPKTLLEAWRGVQHKDVQDRRLVAFGWGDGGGGPTAEMIEMARRTHDLEGCPRTQYTSISQFMSNCERELTDLPTYVGELYLELHRGTLTSVAAIKQANRRCEFGLREAEFLATLATLHDGGDYPREPLRTAWQTLLINQFHDILPGSSIAEVNDEAIAALESCRQQAEQIVQASAARLGGGGNAASVLLVNSLSWARGGELEIGQLPEGSFPNGERLVVQAFRDVEDQYKIAAAGLTLPPLGYAAVATTRKTPAKTDSPFAIVGDTITTPWAEVRFDRKHGWITSFFDRTARRELVRNGGAFNQLLLGEDVPYAWDNWDIDRDQQHKLRPTAELLDWQIIANGPLQLRVRSRYRLSERSTLTQDVVFHSSTPRVDFDTLVDWHEKHQLLKVNFSLDVLASAARHEIQFGHLSRPTHDNTSIDRAQFDVCAHKWTDISEDGYGVAFLNDCKYACTVKAGEYRLTLIKSGRHPDARGDEGAHRFAYAVLPHNEPFGVTAVVRPAYEFNLPLRALPTTVKPSARFELAGIQPDNVVVESIKFAEDQDAVVLRLYEAGRTATHAVLSFGRKVREVVETNLLEETVRPLAVIADNLVHVSFRAFEIKTLVCTFES